MMKYIAQVGCMRQALGPGALGKPRGSRWRGRWEGGIGMGNTCKPMAVSFQCITKYTTNYKKKYKYIYIYIYIYIYVILKHFFLIQYKL